MDASALKVFLAVARSGGMTRAAEELHTVQSNVTARIRHLEEELGVPLFERQARGVVLSPAGLRLFPYAQRVLDLLDEAAAAAADNGDPRGALRIGSLETVAAMHLTALTANFLSDYPAVDVSFVTGTSCELLQHVVDRRVEGAFVCGPVDHPQLEAAVVFREELVLLAPPGSSDWRRHCTGDARVVVLKIGCSYRQRLEDLLYRQGAASVRVLELGTIEAIVGMISAGQGVTLLPRRLMEGAYGRAAVSCFTLPADMSMVETVFVHRKDGFMSSALRAFMERLPLDQPALAG